MKIKSWMCLPTYFVGFMTTITNLSVGIQIKLISVKDTTFTWNTSQNSILLSYYNLSFEICHHLFFLFCCNLSIDIHGCCNIGMSHDILNNLQVSLILAKSGTEGMTKIVCRKAWKEHCFSFLPFGLNFLPVIIGLNYPTDCVIYCTGTIDCMWRGWKNKARVSIYLPGLWQLNKK